MSYLQYLSVVVDHNENSLHIICREFRVNETWLRTGEGEMFQKRSRVDELTDFISSIMNDDDGFRLALITVLSRLEPEQWKTLANIAEQLTREMEVQKRG